MTWVHGRKRKYGRQDAYLSCDLGQAIDFSGEWRQYFMCLKKWAWARLYVKVPSSNKFSDSCKGKMKWMPHVPPWMRDLIQGRFCCPIRLHHLGSLEDSHPWWVDQGAVLGPEDHQRGHAFPSGILKAWNCIFLKFAEILTNCTRERIQPFHQISKRVHDPKKVKINILGSVLPNSCPCGPCMT